MPYRKLIAVVGATGAQGGGLVRSILADSAGEFAVRALTRHPGSAKARALATAGADVVEADLDEPATLGHAFAGCHGAFCVTNFWEHFSPERELAQAQAMAAAARAAGLRHVIWSTLEDTRLRVPLDDPRMPTLHGRYKVPHLDAKGEADRFFAEADVATTFLLTSFYWENLIHFGMGPRPGPDGQLVLALPLGNARMASIAAEDIGRCAHGIFRRGTALAGRRIGVAAAHLTGAEMAAAIGRALGRPVRYEPIPFGVYRGLGFPGADDLGNMFQYFHDFADEVCAARPVAGSRELNPALQDFGAWLEAHREQLLPAAG